ncbi:hypothetical protein ACP4OV_024736 [Aristida adscensionis]
MCVSCLPTHAPAELAVFSVGKPLCLVSCAAVPSDGFEYRAELLYNIMFHQVNGAQDQFLNLSRSMHQNCALPNS